MTSQSSSNPKHVINPKNSNPIKGLLIEQALRCELKDYTLVDKNQKQKLAKH
jgi:hypothetical protein